MPTSRTNAPRDGNRVTVLLGVASETVTIDGVEFIEGVTPVPIAVNPVDHALIVEVA